MTSSLVGGNHKVRSPILAKILGMTENQVRYAVKVGSIPVGASSMPGAVRSGPRWRLMVFFPASCVTKVMLPVLRLSETG